MENKLVDLNDHLFAEIERLGDEDLTAEAVATEATRANAMVRVADQIVNNARLQLQAVRMVAEHGDHLKRRLPPMLAGPVTIEGNQT